MNIGSKTLGIDAPVYVIAEAGINHDGKLDQALELIDVAAHAGADCVKFQLFNADRMYHREPGQYTTAKGESVDIYDLVASMAMPVEWIPILHARCRGKKIDFLSTACDVESVDALREWSSAIKVASYEMTHIPLLSYLCQKKVPVIFSTAGAQLAEVIEAWNVLSDYGKYTDNIAIMQCVAKYPAPADATNLKVFDLFRTMFPGIPVGLSDHSQDPVEVPRHAVHYGATMIEKHFTIDRKLPGADHSFAVDPIGLQAMVRAIREATEERHSKQIASIPDAILGNGVKTTIEVEESVRAFAYRGLFSTRDIAEGETLTAENMAVLRPGNKSNGLHARYYSILIGSKAKATTAIPAHTGITWDKVLSSS